MAEKIITPNRPSVDNTAVGTPKEADFRSISEVFNGGGKLVLLTNHVAGSVLSRTVKGLGAIFYGHMEFPPEDQR